MSESENPKRRQSKTGTAQGNDQVQPEGKDAQGASQLDSRRALAEVYLLHRKRLERFNKTQQILGSPIPEGAKSVEAILDIAKSLQKIELEARRQRRRPLEDT